MNVRYRVGIDVGLYSVGFAAIGYDQDAVPMELLNAISLIHDAGVDPAAAKQAHTRRMTSGIARRTRTMYAARKKRLEALDGFLRDAGFPIINMDGQGDRQAWQSRAVLAEVKFDDADQMHRHLSIAVRHMARHRGWRNPYTTVETLMQPQEPSEGYITVVNQLVEQHNVARPEGKTLAQLVVEIDQPTVKLRGDGGLFSERLRQQDVANEIHRFGQVQKLPAELVRELITYVFFAKSPKGSAAERVAKDPLAPSQPRALRASLEFQRYRIISLLANIRIREGHKKRVLTVAERQKAFNVLYHWTDATEPTWNEIATLFRIDRGDLLGTASSTDDGERVTNTPPTNITHRVLSSTGITSIKQYWKKADEKARQALISELSNSELSDESSPEGISAAALIRDLSAEDLQKLEDLRIPDGRAAYSSTTLTALADHQLKHESDLSTARVEVFKVSNDWTPPAPEIGEPTGNAAVDRVLKAVQRWLLLAEKRWGLPESVNIEHVRDGFSSAKVAREIERDNKRRNERNAASGLELQKAAGLEGRPRRSEVSRYIAYQRQHGQCAYCGQQLALKTLELDHIVPRAGVGSNNSRTNLLAVCKSCNLSKGKQPFAVWAAQPGRAASQSLGSAIERVKTWSEDPGMSKKESKRFQNEVISRLKRVSEDEELDVRSIESVAWMANELRHRIQGRYADHRADIKVRVFRGSITAEARRAAGMDKKLKMIGGFGKTRLDRRHHAIDAAVVATLSAHVAQVLLERSNLRSAEWLSGLPDPAYGAWKEFEGASVEHKSNFRRWKSQLDYVVALLQSGLDSDTIPVSGNLRLRLGSGEAHEATIRPFRSGDEYRERIELGAALTAEQIDRSATEAQWCALTRLPDFTWEAGLPEDPNRQIRIHGTTYLASEDLKFFGGKSAAIGVRGGYAELGDSVHHVRIYRINAGKKTVYAMLRVFTVDLAPHTAKNLFAVELSPQTISWRSAEPLLRKAKRSGDAEYLTWIVAGDELEFDAVKAGRGDVEEVFAAYGPIRRWRVYGFPAVSKFRLRPSQLAGEGLSEDSSAGVLKNIRGSGWRPAVNVLFGAGELKIVRRDAHGRERAQAPGSSLPRTVVI